MIADTTPELLQELTTLQIAEPVITGPARRWMPKRVVFTPAALTENPMGRAIRDRVEALGLPVEELPANPPHRRARRG